MPVFTLREKYHPIIPCICSNCHDAIFAAYKDNPAEAERQWQQRVRIHDEDEARLRGRMKNSFDDPCEVAERRRARRGAAAVVAA